MMETENERERTTLAMAVARMWQDTEYKRQFIADPKTELGRAGVKLAPDISVKVVEETPAIQYLDLGRNGIDLLETLRELVPLPEGREVRIVQSTANLHYLVLPSAPGWISPGVTSGNDLLNLSEKLPPTTVSETSVGAQETIQITESVEATMDVETVIHTLDLTMSNTEVNEVTQVVVESSATEVVSIA